MTNINKQVGELIKQARKECNLKQEDVASLSQTHKQAICRLEKGHISPKVDTLEKIAKALHRKLVIEFRDLS